MVTKEIKRFGRSLSHAMDGLAYAIKNERNFRIELGIAFIVTVSMAVLRVKSWEAIVLMLMMMWVIVAELANTAAERIVDILKPRVHPYARLIKDIMAAVVLISSMVAVSIGFIIFMPYVRDLAVTYAQDVVTAFAGR